jgi:hypothetical protein
MLLVWFELQSDTELWAPIVFTLQTSSVIPLWWPLDWKPATIKHTNITKIKAKTLAYHEGMGWRG